MERDYYVFQTEAQANACLAVINGAGWFPVVSRVNGVPAPDKQKAEKWCSAPVQMLSGEWAIPRIPASLLNARKVTSKKRKEFMAVFGQDIRTLTEDDFPVVEVSL